MATTLPLKHIIQVMNAIQSMPLGLRLLLHETPERIELAKNRTLLRPGEMCDNLYYIEKGILGSYEKDGHKRVYTWLMLPGDIATSVESFNMRVPAKEFVETITDCTLHALSWEKLQQFTETYREFGTIRQHLTDRYHLQARNMDAQRKRTPEHFYDYLKKEYGDYLKLNPISCSPPLWAFL